MDMLSIICASFGISAVCHRGAIATFFKGSLGFRFQPVLPHLCCLFIDVALGCGKLVLWVVVMIAQSGEHLST